MRHAEAVTGRTGAGYEKYRYGPAVRAGGFIFLSGVIGCNADGSACATAAEEYHAAFRQIVETLAEFGATMADVIAIDSFHVSTDLRKDILEMTQVRAHYMDAPHPTTTGIGVASLAIAGARAEIKVTAYIGG